MKGLLASFIAAVIVLGTSATATAASTWKLDVFQPESPTTHQNVRFEYAVISKDATDTFSVTLTRNGSHVETQNVTGEYGGSGVFAVTLPQPGEHTFTVTATESDGTFLSETRAITLSQPVSTVDAGNGGVSNVVIENATSGGTRTGTVLASGSAAGATGTVSDQAASITKEVGQTLGTDSKKEVAAASKDDNMTGNDWLWAIPAFAVLGGAYYWFFQRLGRGPFVRS